MSINLINKYIGLAVLCVVILLSTVQVDAHEWYSASCCGGSDCHPITSCSEILETARGVAWNGVQFTKDMIHPSQDNQCHVCIMHGMNGYSNPLCIYVQQGS